MRWAWCGRVAVADDGTVARLSAPLETALWYRSLASTDIVWTWEGGGAELCALAEARPGERWTGRIGGGTLLELRAEGGASVRDASALAPWLEPPGGADDVRARWVLDAMSLALEELADRGYHVHSDRGRGPRLTVSAVAWATASALAGIQPRDAVGWAEYDCGRRAYYGGRCEVLRTVAPRVVGWDISGAYPWALSQPVPVGGRIGCVTGAAAGAALERGRPGIYYARVAQPDDSTPRLPYRHRPSTGRGRWRGPLMWCTGYVEGWYAPLELHAAEDTGARVEVRAAHLWSSADARWAPYIAHCAADRATLRAAGVDETSAKLLANALSGKLAQGPDATSVRVIADDELPQLGWSWHGGRVWSKRHRSVPSSARPVEAAYVTARVRVELLRALLAAGDEGVYCDTDGLWVREGASPPPGRAPWREIDRGEDWCAPRPKGYTYRRPDGETVTRCSGVQVPLREILAAFACGRGAMPPRRRPGMPALPLESAWAGLRVITEGGATRPLYRERDGRLR